MKLATRLSVFSLAALGLVLVGFSTALYLSARAYMNRQVDDRLVASLAVLAAAAEIHPNGVEWEPQERELPLGQDSGPDRLRWMVYEDNAGVRIDHSRNLIDANLLPEWTPRTRDGRLPGRLVDRQGRTWRIAQRRLRPGVREAQSGSQAVKDQLNRKDPDPPGTVYPSLVLTVCVPLDPLEATLSSLRWVLIGMTASIWLIAATVSRWVCRKALEPLTLMVESATGLDATDAGWSLSNPGTGDELEDLGRAFNELLARLRLAYERQRRFSSEASHQLRTPLTALIGQLEVALRRDRPDEEYRRVLEKAHGRAVQLGQIVEALLFLGRAEGEAGFPDAETLELGPWLSEHLAERAVGTRAANIAFEAPENGAIWVRVHPPLLAQLVDNLLDNACKYSPAGSPILLHLNREAGSATLAVQDAGAGIAPQDLPRIFEPFYRSAEARLLGRPGTGLGLAVARRIATAFGGTIDVQSDLGKGSRFELRLPSATPSLVNSIPASLESVGVSDDLQTS